MWDLQRSKCTCRPNHCKIGLFCAVLVTLTFLYWVQPSWLWCVFTHVGRKGKQWTWNICSEHQKSSYDSITVESKTVSDFMRDFNDVVEGSNDLRDERQACEWLPHVLGNGQNTYEMKDVKHKITCERLKKRKIDCNTRGRKHHLLHQRCSSAWHGTICNIKFSPGHAVPDCDRNVCITPISLGILKDQWSGSVQWVDFANINELESYLRIVTDHRTSLPLIGIIKCARNFANSSNNDNDENMMTQVFALPPPSNLTKGDQKKNIATSTYINVNMVILRSDSFSRDSILQIMPRTVASLREVSSGTDHTKSLTLDFQLFQSMHLMPAMREILPEQKINQTQAKKSGIVRLASSREYHTLFLEEFCADKMYHMDTERQMASRIHSLKSQLANMGVNDVGPSMLKCSLSDYLINSSSCSYYESLLDYMDYFQVNATKHLRPYLSIFSVDVDDAILSGTLYNLDNLLAKHIKNWTKLSSTLTVIISDLKNDLTESHFFTEFNDKLDLSNPVLFMIAPKPVQDVLGEFRMKNLLQNQHRLVTFEDLRTFIQDMIEKKETAGDLSLKQGLASSISPDRLCKDLPNLDQQPFSALCLCRDQNVPSPLNRRDVLIAEFALGTLNNLIRNTTESGARFLHDDGLTGEVHSCHPLKVWKFDNISRSYHDDDWMTTSLYLYLDAPSSSGKTLYNIMRVGIRHRIPDDQHPQSTAVQSSSMQLVSYKRLTPYAKYSVCTGNIVKPDLCVCDPVKDKTLGHLWNISFNSQNIFRVTESTMKYQNSYLLLKAPPTMFGVTSSIQEMDPNEDKQCLYLLHRNHGIGDYYEVMNVCGDRLYYVIFDISGNNVICSTSVPVRHKVAPLSGRFLLTVTDVHINHTWHYRYSLQYTFVQSREKKS